MRSEDLADYSSSVSEVPAGRLPYLVFSKQQRERIFEMCKHHYMIRRFTPEVGERPEDLSSSVTSLVSAAAATRDYESDKSQKGTRFLFLCQNLAGTENMPVQPDP